MPIKSKRGSAVYEIPIDEFNYHTNLFTKDELLWGESTYKRVLKRYPDLKNFISVTLSPLHLDKIGTERIMKDITLAFCHTIKLSKTPKTEEQLDKTIKGYIHSFLPFIAENLSVARYSHLIQFEPIALTCHYLAITASELLSCLSLAGEASTEFEEYFIAEVVGLLRIIHSSLALLSIGDDVHGVSLYRGALEITAKLMLANQFADEYVLFKKFNAYLQMNKFNGDPLPPEMTDYMNNEPSFKINPENFLAYGWAKNSNGKRILTMKEFVTRGLKSGIRSLPFLQLASEFTHEDYIGVGYDYISIRKAMVDHFYILLKAAFSNVANDKLLSKKEIKKICHLQSLADPIYTGEIPLSELTEN